MTARENELLKRLQKRLDWLTKRIYTDSADKTDLSFDRAEAHALEWAIGIIEKNLEATQTPEGCRHTWSYWKEDKVFCKKCLEIKNLVAE